MDAAEPDLITMPWEVHSANGWGPKGELAEDEPGREDRVYRRVLEDSKLPQTLGRMIMAIVTPVGLQCLRKWLKMFFIKYNACYKFW